MYHTSFLTARPAGRHGMWYSSSIPPRSLFFFLCFGSKCSNVRNLARCKSRYVASFFSGLSVTPPSARGFICGAPPPPPFPHATPIRTPTRCPYTLGYKLLCPMQPSTTAVVLRAHVHILPPSLTPTETMLHVFAKSRRRTRFPLWHHPEYRPRP